MKFRRSSFENTSKIPSHAKMMKSMLKVGLAVFQVRISGIAVRTLEFPPKRGFFAKISPKLRET